MIEYNDGKLVTNYFLLLLIVVTWMNFFANGTLPSLIISGSVGFLFGYSLMELIFEGVSE